MEIQVNVLWTKWMLSRNMLYIYMRFSQSSMLGQVMISISPQALFVVIIIKIVSEQIYIFLHSDSRFKRYFQYFSSSGRRWKPYQVRQMLSNLDNRLSLDIVGMISNSKATKHW